MLMRLIAPITESFGGEAYEGVADLVAEITALLDGLTITIEGCSTQIAASVIDDISKVANVPIGWTSMNERYGFHSVQLLIDLDDFAEVTFVWDDKTVTAKEVPLMLQRAVSDQLYSELATEILASHLAHPGLIGMEQPFVYVGETLWERHDEISWTLQEAIDVTEVTKWPTIQIIPLATTSKWLRNLPGYLEGIGKGRVGRAVAALSHIISKSPAAGSAIDLSWALLGLEALYASGNQGLAQQLSAKTEIVLGPRTENKKTVSQMYDYRSRFLHGGLDMPFAFRQYLSNAPDDDFGPEAYHCWRVGCTLLVATLQEIILRDTYSFEFTYTLL